MELNLYSLHMPSWCAQGQLQFDLCPLKNYKKKCLEFSHRTVTSFLYSTQNYFSGVNTNTLSAFFQQADTVF
jgi:hypothetical protein